MAIDPRSLPFEHKKFCVYLYRDPRRGKKQAPIYVGKGATGTRPDVHWQYGSHNDGLNAAFAELKKADLEPSCEYVEFFDDEKDALRLEKALIERIGRADIGTGPLLNRAPGGPIIRRPPRPRAISAKFDRQADIRAIFKRRRIQCGLTQAEMAERLEMSRIKYSRIEGSTQPRRLDPETRAQIDKVLSELETEMERQTR